MRQPKSMQVAAARFVLTPALVLSAALMAGLELIIPRLEPISTGIVWPLVTLTATLAATVLWLLGQRWPTRMLICISGIIVGLFAFIPPHPKVSAERVSASTSELSSALAGQDATPWDHGVLFVLIAAAFICSCGRTRSPSPRVRKADANPPARLDARTGIAAAVVLALVLSAAIPAGSGVRSLNQAAMRARAETITRYDPPKTTHVDTDVKVGKKHGWSRKGFRGVMPTGELTIGVRDHTVVGLRTRDGAKRWQYDVGTSEQRYIDNVTVDDDSRTVLVRVGSALVGIGFDGRISYHTKVPQPSGTLTAWSDQGRPDPAVSRGQVAVLASAMDGRTKRAYGFDVSSGQKLWQVNTQSPSCKLAATTHDDTGYVLTAGTPWCRTRLLRFDGSSQRFDRTLKPPHGLKSAKSSVAKSDRRFRHGRAFTQSPPAVQALDADHVAVQPIWEGLSGKTVVPTQLLDSAGAVRGTLHGSPLSGAPFPDSLLFPVRRAGAPGGGQRYGLLDETGKHRTEWLLFDKQLHRKSSVPIPEAFGSVRRIGQYLDITGQRRHHLRRIDDNLTHIDTINTETLPACGPNTGTRDVHGDGEHVALYCWTTSTKKRKHNDTHRVFVRAVS